jgi:hypothetical protein
MGFFQAAFQDMNAETLMSRISDLTALPVMPSADNPLYPRSTPLLITTARNTKYMLPVSGSEAVFMTTEDLRAAGYQPRPCIHPTCTLLDPYMPRGDYLPQKFEPTVAPSFSLSGEAALISNTGDTVALWRLNALEIYLHYERDYGTGSHLLNTTTLVDASLFTSSTSLKGTGAWSPDGRLLAFSDVRGLWLWDALTTGSQPRLLVATGTNGIPIARHFSPLGRYLAVSEGERGYQIDIISGTRLPDGLVSPDERYLLEFDSAATGAFPLRMSSLVNSPEWDILLTWEFTAYQVQWLKDNSFLMAQCDLTYLITDARPINEPWCAIFRLNAGFDSGYLAAGYAFAYDSDTGDLATLVNGFTVNINDTAHVLYLDSDIIKIEWLPSLFYYDENPVRLNQTGK